LLLVVMTPGLILMNQTLQLAAFVGWQGSDGSWRWRRGR
jgi:hypothetical protein